MEGGIFGLEDIEHEEPDGFKGVNCRHDWYPYLKAYHRHCLASYPEPILIKAKHDAYQTSQRQDIWKGRLERLKTDYCI